MSERSINNIKETIESVFVECGDYICVDKDDKDDEETWRDAFRGKFPDLTEDDIDVLISIANAHGWENDECLEINTDEFADVLCKRNGCELIKWCTDQVFDSCGLDIFVLSFVIDNDSCNELMYSFHNVYYRN